MDTTRRAFLPLNPDDMAVRGWESPDFLIVSGDAYVDHPSFGHAIIGRLLEAEGYRVGIIAQPDWRGTEDIRRLGVPRLGVLISGGVVDSMVNNYSPAGRRRTTDAYSPGGVAGRRPDRAVIVYANRVREAFGRSVPIIIGGIEASLRRFSHYDFISDHIRRSILLDARADFLVFGMGERQLLELAGHLKDHPALPLPHDIRGTLFASSFEGLPEEIREFVSACRNGRSPRKRDRRFVLLPSHEEVTADRIAFARAWMDEYHEQDPVHGRTLVQASGDRFVVQLPPAVPLSTDDLDRIYRLPFTRRAHPDYDAAGGVPALTEVQFSVTGHRGCFGGCHFCALAYHQGQHIQTRSDASILDEIQTMVKHPDFRGSIHDIGGPTANFRQPPCRRQATRGHCRGRACLSPKPCEHLDIDHRGLASLLEKCNRIPGVRHLFLRSGIRFDYLVADRDQRFFKLLCRHHVSGQLKIAPEHSEPAVLEMMGKPSLASYHEFRDKFFQYSHEAGKEQYLVPYFISGHPGCTLEDAVHLAEFIRDLGHGPQQVQEFCPTPGTLSTAMYHTGLDPRTLTPVHVPRGHERSMQRALLQFWKPENHAMVREALSLTGRTDLIGHDARCLIREAGLAPARRNKADSRNTPRMRKKRR